MSEAPPGAALRRRPVVAGRGGARAAHCISVFMRAAWRIQVHGAAHVPDTGPVIVAGNHIGLLDGPVLFVSCPRPVHFLVKSEVFTPAVGRLMRAVGQIPVRRGSPDRAALAAALEVLAAGRVLGVFPEGQRGDGDFSAFHHGLAYLALRSGAPIVPAACLVPLAAEHGPDGEAPAPRRRFKPYPSGLPRPLRTRRHVAFGVPFTEVWENEALPAEEAAGPSRPARVQGGRHALLAASERVRGRLVEHLHAARSAAPAPASTPDP